jgi:hypothetical protein
MMQKELVDINRTNDGKDRKPKVMTPAILVGSPRKEVK